MSSKRAKPSDEVDAIHTACATFRGQYDALQLALENLDSYATLRSRYEAAFPSRIYNAFNVCLYEIVNSPPYKAHESIATMLAFGSIWHQFNDRPGIRFPTAHALESNRCARSEIENIAHVATTCLKIRDSIDVAQSFVSQWNRDNAAGGS